MIQTSSKNSAAAQEMVTFMVGGQEFCIDVMSIREIRVWTPATPIAHAPHYVCGVINLRGAVLAIVDLAAKLGFPPTEPSTRHAILVVQIGDQSVGLLVEGVSEILSISRDNIQPTPDVASQVARDYVSGVIALDGRMISMISAEAIVPPSKQRDAA